VDALVVEGCGELLDLLVAEGRNEVVDVELLDGTLDDVADDVVEAEAVHEAADGAGVQVDDAAGLALATDDAADGTGGEAKDVAGLTLDDTLNDVVGVEAVGEAANGAGGEVEGLVGVARLADNVADGARSQTENIARLALDNALDDLVDVEAVSKTTDSAGAKVEGLVRVAGLANNAADGAGSKAKNIARLALDNTLDDLVGVEAVSETTDSAGAKVEGLVRVAGLANNVADSARGKAKDIARLALDNALNDVVDVQAIGEAANSAGGKVESLVGVLRVANDGADGTRAEAEDGAGLLALQDVADSVVEVEAVGEAANGARAEAEGLVSVAAVAAEDRADGARVKTESIAGVTLDIKTETVDGTGDAVEERGDGAGNDVTLDDVEAADSLVDSGDKAVDDVTLGGNINVDVVDDVLDVVKNAALDLGTNLDAVEDVLDIVESVANNGALGHVEAADSVDDIVDGATDTVTNKAVDEVTGLDTNLDAVDCVLHVADSSRDGVVDDTALDIEAKAGNDREAAGDGADIDDVVDTGKELTLGGHGEGRRRKGESDESVLHLEKGVWVLTKVVKLVKESVVEKMSCLCVEEESRLESWG
jgi:hypothetical protein